jgi:hypothetical protein
MYIVLIKSCIYFLSLYFICVIHKCKHVSHYVYIVSQSHVIYQFGEYVITISWDCDTSFEKKNREV